MLRETVSKHASLTCSRLTLTLCVNMKEKKTCVGRPDLKAMKLVIDEGKSVNKVNAKFTIVLTVTGLCGVGKA